MGCHQYFGRSVRSCNIAYGLTNVHGREINNTTTVGLDVSISTDGDIIYYAVIISYVSSAGGNTFQTHPLTHTVAHTH